MQEGNIKDSDMKAKYHGKKEHAIAPKKMEQRVKQFMTH
jgi:hypothetical protein